jgi:hypothetical protein
MLRYLVELFLDWAAVRGYRAARKVVNMNFWESFALNFVVGLLHAAVKNPAKFAGLEHVLITVRDDATLIVSGLDPNAPPPPGYKPI